MLLTFLCNFSLTIKMFYDQNFKTKFGSDANSACLRIINNVQNYYYLPTLTVRYHFQTQCFVYDDFTVIITKIFTKLKVTNYLSVYILSTAISHYNMPQRFYHFRLICKTN